MAENSRHFGSGSYSAAQFAEVLRRFVTDGVLQGVGGELKCTTGGDDMNVDVADGEAFVDGYWYDNSASIAEGQTADEENPRINRVVLRWSATAGTITVETLAGTPAATPSAPTLTWATGTKEISLCQVSVEAGETTLQNSDITDERPWAGAAGPLTAEMTNKSGGALAMGAVVVTDATADEGFTTTTAARDQDVIGVVSEDDGIADDAEGTVIRAGMAMVNMDAATTRGQFIVTSTTAGKATPKTNYEIGAFGVAMDSIAGAGLCRCWLWGSAIGGTSTPTAYMPVSYDSSAKIDSDALDEPNSRHAFVWFIGGNMTTGANKSGMKYQAKGDETFTEWKLVCSTAPTGATLIVDINKDGTTLFTTQGNRPTIAISGTEAAGAAPDVTTAAEGTSLSVDVDQVGSTIAGADLTVMLFFKRPLIA